MGNCLATEASDCITIQNSDGKIIQILQSSKTASQVMTSYLGYFVAEIVTLSNSHSENERGIKCLKLLRPGDPLLPGKVYMLINFEDVLRVFGSEREVLLSRLQEKAGEELRDDRDNSDKVKAEDEEDEAYRSFKAVLRQLRWKPALETIVEF